MIGHEDSAATEPTAQAHEPVRPNPLCPNVVQGERAGRSGAQGLSDAEEKSDADETEESNRGEQITAKRQFLAVTHSMSIAITM